MSILPACLLTSSEIGRRLVAEGKIPAARVRCFAVRTEIANEAAGRIELIPCRGIAGHGCAAIYLRGHRVLFAGPCVVNGPRARLPGSDTELWVESLKRLEKLGVRITLIDKDLGYELRCADPIPFDAEYTRDLGYGAVKFLLSAEADKFGAIVSFEVGKLVPLPFEKMLDSQTGRMQVRRVNVDGEAYECACHYMIRLQRSDFEIASQLKKLAASVSMTPEQFRQRFGYVVGLK